MTNSMSEIENTDCILITGSNTAENHPIIGRMVKRAVDRRRAKLIIIDPRKVSWSSSRTSGCARGQGPTPHGSTA